MSQYSTEKIIKAVSEVADTFGQVAGNLMNELLKLAEAHQAAIKDIQDVSMEAAKDAHINTTAIEAVKNQTPQVQQTDAQNLIAEKLEAEDKAKDKAEIGETGPKIG